MMTMVMREGIGKKKMRRRMGEVVMIRKMRMERRKGVAREEYFLLCHHLLISLLVPLLVSHAAELFHSNSY